MSLTASGKAVRVTAEGDPTPPDDTCAEPKAEAATVADVYLEQRPRLLRFLGKRLGRAEAEDVVQQSFLRLLSRQADDRDEVAQPRNYLFRIAWNLANDADDRARRQFSSAHIPLDDVELAGSNQLAALEARDELDRLEALICRMKPRTREIFLAHRLDGYSYREIAALTGLSVKGVERHMSLAIAFIDRRLGVR